MGLNLKFFSSLDKVYPEVTWEKQEPHGTGTMLCNEIFSFQLGYIYDGEEGFLSRVRVEIEPNIPEIEVYRVGQIPGQYIRPVDADHQFEKQYPGLFPDALLPLEQGNTLKLCGDGANALWIKVDGKKLFETTPDKPLTQPITLRFWQNEEVTVPLKEEKLMAEATYTLNILPYHLPPQEILFTQWIHADCIAHWHDVPVLSEKWWDLMEKYIACGIKNGINLLFVPIFTPPLDTAIGEERLTVQLIGVTKIDNQYHFDFTNLKRWIEIGKKYQVSHFEISHLYSQWGAKYAPKIEACVHQETKKIFGWETLATDEAYMTFLDSLLPQLVDFLKNEGIYENTYFHVSDEPNESQLTSYRIANETVKKYVGVHKIMDAISDFSFYEKGMIGVPVCATDAIDIFLEKEVQPLFAYYCSAQKKGVSNRFFGMPQVRNRCIGIQMYHNHIQGFLHWGYNYWLSYGSKHSIDPYLVTDCERIYPSGDCFSVYPSIDGPIESTRLVVFHEALQDVRLLKLLEDKLGKTKLDALLEDYPYKTFNQCPSDASTFLDLRNKLLEALVKA